jgi:hypothetical protein
MYSLLFCLTSKTSPFYCWSSSPHLPSFLAHKYSSHILLLTPFTAPPFIFGSQVKLPHFIAYTLHCTSFHFWLASKAPTFYCLHPLLHLPSFSACKQSSHILLLTPFATPPFIFISQVKLPHFIAYTLHYTSLHFGFK